MKQTPSHIETQEGISLKSLKDHDEDIYKIIKSFIDILDQARLKSWSNYQDNEQSKGEISFSIEIKKGLIRSLMFKDFIKDLSSLEKLLAYRFEWEMESGYSLGRLEYHNGEFIYIQPYVW